MCSEIPAALSRKCTAASAVDSEKKQQKLSDIQADVQESKSLMQLTFAKSSDETANYFIPPLRYEQHAAIDDSICSALAGAVSCIFKICLAGAGVLVLLQLRTFFLQILPVCSTTVLMSFGVPLVR